MRKLKCQYSCLKEQLAVFGGGRQAWEAGRVAWWVGNVKPSW